MTRILIVDDSALARRAIRAVLAESPAFDVAGEAVDAESGITRARELRPDLVLMDLRMPRRSGLDAIRVIKEELPGTIVVVLSVSDDPQDFFEAIRCGAQGYLIKNVDPGVWLEYLEALVHGDARISRAIASRILREFTQSAAAPAELPALTRREEEILGLVARGLPNKEIADTLGIVEGTVKRHLQNILEKLHLRNRVELATFAVRRGLTPPDAGADTPGGS